MPTIFVNGTQLLAAISGGLTGSPGLAAITVSTSGQTSAAMAFAVLGAYGASFNHQVLATAAPPPSGCVRPAAKNSFLTTDGAVYLYFEANVAAVDNLSNDWLAPDGTVVSGDYWDASSGNYCFTGSSLGIPSGPFGAWQARVYDNGSLVFAIPFSIASSGAPLLHSATAPPEWHCKTTSRAISPLTGEPSESGNAGAIPVAHRAVIAISKDTKLSKR